ncbi:MAG: AMP-binding protein, partial [Candidatus Methanomethylophilaceae archaeon]|nr:AMP-binding protein [Candidatus Methanomethylophilaceae archaeon]
MNGCTRLLREMAAYALDNPDKTAVCDGSGSVTYSEFWSRIGRLSNLLRLRGVSAGDAVVIDLDRNSEHLASRYAALAVGAVPVSLSPAYPEARKKAVAERTGAKAVIDDGFVKESEGLPDTAEIDDVDDSAPGYIAFTSGSTGEPKGVVHERSVFPYLMDCYRSADVDITGMRLGALSDFSFIASMVETHIFLAAGAEVHIIDRGAAKDPASLLRYFKSNSIDSALFNPSMYKALSDKLDLRICLLAGEAARRIPVPEGRMVLNIYGSTEALMSFTLVDKDVPDVRVDRTAPGCRLYLDGSGEILFTGRGIMIGYLGGLENPFSVDADGRTVFRTGDLGREVEGGIAVVGRMDGMVKVRGYRVEPAEIERNMENIPGIEEAAVKAFEDGGGAYLCGYFRSGTVTEEEVAKELSRTLPSYMVPQFISKVGSFIHNANGKIDRTSLTTLKTGKGNYVPPENERQREICEAFSKVLDIERVGIDDDFIDLGGDSIRAMRLQSETGIGVGDVMRLRTPRRIAESAAEQSPDAIPDWKGGCAPNESQMNVYLDMEANGRSNEYNVFFEVPLDPGTSDADAWRAVDSVIAAHPVLRARMASRDGRPWILFDAEPERCGPEDEGFEDRPFILSEGMCRFSVRKNKVLVCACHIVMDGYSAKVVERDMRNSLEGMALSEDAGFMLSSVRDSRMKDSGAYAEARAFFDSMLDDADAGLLHDHDGSLGITDHELSTDAEKVSELARCMGTTAGAVHTAAFAYALSRFTGRSDATFCIADNGRDSRGLEDSVGMFVRTVPVRMDCSDRGVRGFIAESSDVLLKSVSYGYYPFRRLASEHGVGREVMFQYRSDMGVDGGRSSGSRRGTVSDFSFIVGDSGKGLVVRIERSSAFSEGTARRLAETYDRILTGLCECGRLSEIGYLPDEDSSLSKGIEGPRAELRRGNLVEAFREAVSLFPERTAVSFRGRRVTYSEADGITDGIASELSRRGIGSGDFVGVLVPRSEWYFLCAIGVLKTGAAYVPMDDAYPDERLSLMARDTSSKAVLALPETMGRANRLSDGRALDCSSIRKEGFRPVDINPLSPAVVLYTSGTTGKPKGSVITHRAIDNMCEWYVGYTCMSEEDVYSLYTSYSFDIHTIGLFSPLYSGASVDIVPEEVRLDMPALNGHFIDADTTHTFMTTQVGKLFASMDMPSKIKALMYGGEKLGEFHAPEHLGAIETYGPSENLALSTAIMVNDRNYPDSVGRLLPNMKAYVLDAERRPVPRGAVGELYLSGYQLSLGYLNRDESNARAFFDNPFSDEPGFERMYATGDFFRVLPDGILGVVGRRDGQVKIRGNRVELTEIETAIRDMPGIRDVTVQAVPSGPGKELCAYVVGE